MKATEPRSYTFKNTWTCLAEFLCRVRERNLPDKGSAPLYCIAFNLSHPRHQHIFATAGGTRASVYECKEDGSFELMQVYHDPNEGEELFTCQWTQDEVPGAPLLLLAGKLGCLSVVNCATKQLEWQGLGHGDAINDISVDPGRPCIVVTASRDRTLRLWNIRTRVCISILGGEGGHRNEVLSIDFHPFDSNKVLSASLDHSVKIWDLQSVRKYIEESHNYNDAVAQEAFPTVRLQFPHFTSRKVHNAYVDCVRWMGDIVLSKSVHNVIFMWEPDCTSTDSLQKGFIHLLHELPLREAHAWFIRFALNPACSVLACGAVDGHVRIWAPQDGSSDPRRIVRCTSANPSQNMTVRQTAVSFDGNTVLACCEDASIWRFEAMPDARKAT